MRIEALKKSDKGVNFKQKKSDPT